MNPQFVSKRTLSKTIELSPETFKKYRLAGIWVEGIHWQRVNSRCVLYNLPLVLDWLSNRNSPQVHQRTIEAYLQAQSSNQSKRSRRAS